MFRKMLPLALLIAAAMVGPLPAAAGPDFEEGKWEIIMEIEMPGMPMKMPPNTYTQCLRKDNPVPQNESPNQTCTTSDVQTKGDTITWKIKCTGAGGNVSGDGKITYRKDKLEGLMTMQGQGMTVKNIFKGKRIGECD